MLHIFTLAVVLGLSAGFAPGPLLTLVISETLRHDISAGIKVALAPVITDLPIILFTLLVLTKVSDSHLVLAFVSFCGALFIAKLGIGNLRLKGVVIADSGGRRQSLVKGIVANLLSPHPYLFWLSVGVPVMNKAMKESGVQVAVFLVVFYFLLVGSKILLAVIVGKSKHFLQGRVYLITMRVLGCVLLLLAATLFIDGVKLMQEGI